MFKIIKIDGDTIFVGKGDGQFTEINRSAFGFEPTIGDYVDFYENNGEYIISKSDNLAQFTAVTSQAGSKGQSSKSKVVAGILALLVSGFGVYDFYIGRTGMGVARLLITLLALVPVLVPFIAIINIIWSLIIGISVLTSKPGSKWHQDAQGLELQD
ncbi:TM2 domain-containing protein [Streptococcus hyovaginalis]|uniref:TM2 domain-containing protein n=1 Tax=Streptococcus hyovaginalis TaxID=149015 RepID=UPI002A7B027A|nr:TM2 domain-containing protein [Streptococcus hyovaginalis]MDY3024164.1 TM2 domain-containing protein [Streptococcus hyovaginalis]MDY4510356.1 TM2 domain-containing protein [Streptococcus hyovaginalis]